MGRWRGRCTDSVEQDRRKWSCRNTNNRCEPHLYTLQQSDQSSTRQAGLQTRRGVENDEDDEGRQVRARWNGSSICTGILAAVPIAVCLVLSAAHAYRVTEMWQTAERKQILIQKQLIQIGMFIIDLSTEREIMVLYMTTRDPVAEVAFKRELEVSWRRTYQSFSNISVWPGTEVDQQQFQSKSGFESYLRQHRQSPLTDNFQGELQFYTDVIDALLTWCSRTISTRRPHVEGSSGWRWLVSYNHFLAVVNPMGVEQALCSVYRSVVCFSQTETFFFANASFSAEAAFKLYRDNYPLPRDPPNWKDIPRSELFPDLSLCRDGILADMDYAGVSMEPEMCSISRRNESRYEEMTSFLAIEYDLLSSNLNQWWLSYHNELAYRFLGACVLLGCVFLYVITALIIQLLSSVNKTSRRSKRQIPRIMASREELHLSLEGKYEELAPQHPTAFLRQAAYLHVDGTCNHHHNGDSSVMKVATV